MQHLGPVVRRTRSQGSVCEIIASFFLKIVASLERLLILLLKEKVYALLLLYHVSAQLFKDSDLIT